MVLFQPTAINLKFPKNEMLVMIFDDITSPSYTTEKLDANVKSKNEGEDEIVIFNTLKLFESFACTK